MMRRAFLHRCLLVCAFLAGGPVAPARGQETALHIGGYAKNLGIRTSSFFEQNPFYFNLTRLRTRFLLDVSKFTHTEVWLDTEVIASRFLNTAEYRISQQLQRETLADFEWTLRETKNFRVQQRLFRAFATLYLGAAEVTVGRQRVAWGTGYVWNPTDLLNPTDPFAIERLEKDGVDALYVTLPLGTLSRMEAVYAPIDDFHRASAAARLGLNFSGYDFSLMACLFQRQRFSGSLLNLFTGADGLSRTFMQDVVVGGDFAGYLGGAGFRGEFSYTWGEDGADYARAVLNVDYSFPHDYYALLELYYNGQGTADKTSYDYTALLSGESTSLAKHYLAANVSKNLTPLLRTDFYAILNLDDGSALLGPALSYSLATNFELSVNSYFLLGDATTEMGALSSSYFFALQFYF